MLSTGISFDNSFIFMSNVMKKFTSCVFAIRFNASSILDVEKIRIFSFSVFKTCIEHAFGWIRLVFKRPMYGPLIYDVHIYTYIRIILRPADFYSTRTNKLHKANNICAVNNVGNTTNMYSYSCRAIRSDFHCKRVFYAADTHAETAISIDYRVITYRTDYNFL